MAIISILSILKVEGEIQDALNRTAYQMSQYAYAVDVVANSETVGTLKSAAEESTLAQKIPTEIYKIVSGTVSDTVPEALAKSMTLRNFARDNVDEWLQNQGVQGGSSGLDFETTQLLQDGKILKVSVVYRLQVNTYGLFEKVLTIHEQAETVALLPEDYSGGAGSSGKDDGEETSSSIWQESNFTRGKYFIQKIKESNPDQDVKAGQGIDLYDPDTGHYVEGYSMNIFRSTYSTSGGDPSNPNSYTPNAEAIQKMLEEYAKDMEEDLGSLGDTVEMTDGRMLPKVAAQKKTMILILPEEAKKNSALTDSVKAAANQVEKSYGITVDLRYSEKALEQEADS